MTENQKKIIRKFIMDYDLEEYPSEYLYNKIYKMPISIYFEGILSYYKITVDDIKDITRQIIEDSSSFELTFNDGDWDNLNLEEIEVTRTYYNGPYTHIEKKWNTKKNYMHEFFEL